MKAQFSRVRSHSYHNNLHRSEARYTVSCIAPQVVNVESKLTMKRDFAGNPVTLDKDI